MAAAAETYRDQELAELRLLTELHNFLEHMDEDGNVPDNVFAGVVLNRNTAISEIAMPFAVTETCHDVEYRTSEQGRTERLIMWLGKTAIEVAESGYKYHFSSEAHKRVDIEVDEACNAQEKLRPDVAQVFISPRMSKKDASVMLAKAEHLYADDAVRVSTAITNDKGEVVGRRLRSLLVRGVPLSAWVNMLKDSGNIFSKSLPVSDDESALSVMELFNQMELPEELLPEGPVTLIESVLPYIADHSAAERVKYQLERFRGDQAFYAREADMAGREWATFDLELARSMYGGVATETICRFIRQNANAWNEEAVSVLVAHETGEMQYEMSAELAALLSRGMQKLIGDKLSVVTGNDEAIKNVSEKDRQAITASHTALRIARAMGMDDIFIRNLEYNQYFLLHGQQIDSGGGCPGDVDTAFGDPRSPNGVGENDSPFKQIRDSYGDRSYTCPKGHINYREVANILDDFCAVCHVDVSCREAAPSKPLIRRRPRSKNRTAPPPRRGTNHERISSRQRIAATVGGQALASAV